jgi:hypothetical protein
MCPLVDCVACGIVPGKEEEDCVLSRFPRRVERGRQKGEKGDIFILVVRRRSGKVSRTFREENEEIVSIAVIIDERARVKERETFDAGGKPSLLCRRRRRRKSIFHDESNKISIQHSRVFTFIII